MRNQTNSFDGKFWLLTIIGFCFAMLVPLSAVFVVPQFKHVYASFGADLPALTLWVVQAPWLLFIIPILVLLIAFLWPNKRKSAVIACVFGVTSVLWGTAIMLGVLYLPIFKLSAAI